ncbi:zinc finger BED domain-containing protein 1 [Drosophila novamexicana]|uniref:zinc finger BED domain-containing protein 1 n=1 Tax=Drosophila novamexicana TaxID=47314 RepID=UPI0011E60339|nr:zinc finger BED domain-containing protein 1 [Drosophila novamexicana]
MARSKIWKYYDKINLQTAQCLLCEKIIKTCGNTSNLMKHMKTHPQIDVNDHDSIVVRGMLKREPNPIKSRGRKMLKYASIKIKSEPKGEIEADPVGPDMDVNIIELVDAEAHAAVESVVNEETYANWAAAETESAAETASAEDIIEFEPKEAQDHNDQTAALYQTLQQDEQQPEVQLMVSNFQTSHNTAYQDSLAYFVCRDKQPLHIIQGEGFKRLAQVLCPAFQLPSVDQLGAHIGQKAQLQTAQLRQHFAHLQTLSLSCAINTTVEQQSSYLEVTAHYYDGVHRRARTLSVQALPAQYNASNIVERLERVCQRFDIDKSKIVCIVSRSSRLLENAVASLLGSQRHVPCFAHLLETLFELVVQRQEFSALCDKVRRCVAYHLSSCSNLVASQIQLDVTGRAISTYEMLERYVRHAAQLQKVQPLDPALMLTASELELAGELLAVLAPLASAVRQLCGSSIVSYPSASNALPIAYTVLNEMKQPENAEQQHQVSYDIRLFVIRLLEERFEGMEKNTQLALSSLLDPRFRNMPFQSASLVAKYMTQLYDLYEEKGGAIAAESGEEANTESYDIWAAYRAFSHEKHKHITMNGESENMDEISSYFCTNISSLQTEPLLLWKDLSQFHPFLHSLAKKYMHIPASAIPPARIFTAYGEEFAQHRKLMGEHMSNMLLMADCTQEEWQL